MCSTLKPSVVKTLCLSLIGLIFVGCQRIQPGMADRINDTPLVVDEAMQRRDWDPSVVYYPNGAAIAGYGGASFEQNRRIPDDFRRVTDPAIATGNILLLPVTVPLNLRHDPRAFPGASIPPTYTAQPPLD
jgi:hypothetical protein